MSIEIIEIATIVINIALIAYYTIHYFTRRTYGYVYYGTLTIISILLFMTYLAGYILGVRYNIIFAIFWIFLTVAHAYSCLRGYSDHRQEMELLSKYQHLIDEAGDQWIHYQDITQLKKDEQKQQ